MGTEKTEILEQEQDKTETFEEQETELPETVGKVKKLQESFYKPIGRLFEEAEYLGAPLSDLMLSHYSEQYRREYDLMNAKEFAETDKLIEQLRIDRDGEIEAIKLEHEKLRAELKIERVRELESIKLEHEKLLAEIELERDKQEKEVEILREKAQEEYAMRYGEMVPGFYEKRWWQRYARPNEAMKLARRNARYDVRKYLSEQELALAKFEHGPEGAAHVVYRMLESALTMPKSRTKRNAMESEMQELAYTLTVTLTASAEQTNETVLERLAQIIREADEAAPEDVFDESEPIPDEEWRFEYQERKLRERRERKEQKRIEKQERKEAKRQAKIAKRSAKNDSETSKEDKHDQSADDEDRGAGGKGKPGESGESDPTEYTL